MNRDELQVDIDHTRKQLAQTVDALSEKFDLKSRARNKARTARMTVTDVVQAAGTQCERLKVRTEHVWHDRHLRLSLIGGLVAAGAVAAVATAVGTRRR